MTNNKPPAIYATRLCLSGAENRRLLDTFKDFGVEHIQVSFHYLRKTFGDPLEFEQYARNFETVIIDSGTIYGNIKNQDQKDALISDYVSYIAALDKHSYTAAVYEGGHNMEGIVPDEMLIYPLDDIRETFDNDMQAICRNIKYLGVSQKEASSSGGDNLIPVFSQAVNSGTYIHAFGTGSKKLLQKYPFYSANSSTWRSGSRYLNTYIYEGPTRGLRLYQPTDKKDPIKTEKELSAIRRRQEQLVKIRYPDIYPLIDWPELHEGDSWEVDKGNLAQWKSFVTDLGLLGQNKYYLADNEKQALNLRKRDLLANSSTKADIEDVDPSRLAAPKGRAQEDLDIEEGNISPPYIENDIEEADTTRGDIQEGEILDAEVLPDTDVSDIGGTLSTGNTGPPAIENVDPLSALGQALAPRPIAARLTPIDDRIRAPRNCDYCILAGRCPKYAPGATCAYGLPPENPTYDHTLLETHIMEDAADLLAIQKDRILQGYLEEKTDAAGLSKDLSREIKQYMEMVQLLSEATDKRDEVSIKAKGTGIMEMFRKK